MPAPLDVVDELGTLIRDARERLGISQSELSRRMGWRSQSPVSDLETGTRISVSTETLVQLSAVLQLPVEQLQTAAARRVMAHRPPSAGGISSTDTGPGDVG